METNKNTDNNNALWSIFAGILYSIMHVTWKLVEFVKAHGKQVFAAILTCMGMAIVIPALIYFLLFTGAWFLVLLFIFEMTH